MARRNEDKVVRNNNKKAHAKIKAQNRKLTGRTPSSAPRTSRTKSAQPTYGLGGDHVEGLHAVSTLLEHGKRRVSHVFVDREHYDSPEMTQLVYLAEKKHVRVTQLSREQFLGRARTESPQGVIAYSSEIKPVDVDELLDNPNALLVVLDGVTDPHNVGAIVRSAEVAGATGVIVPKHRSGHLTPAAIKSAAGAVEFMKFGLIPGVPAFLQKANKAGVYVIGMAGEAQTSLYDFDKNIATGPMVVVLGSEGKGLSQLTRKRCDDLVKIPQVGKMESLNVSAAAAVTMMHLSHLRL